MKTKRVIILDDHSMFLKGLSLIIKSHCSDCEIFIYQSIDLLKKDKLNYSDFDLFISDIELPGEDTFGLLQSLRNNVPSLPILVVSMHKKNAVIKRCKEIGIKGYLLKDEDEQLTIAMEKIINGEEYYSKAIQEFCARTKNTLINISQREEGIIKLIAKGYSNNEIAEALFLSSETIKTHKKNIKLKLDMSSTSEIIDYANKTFLL